MRRVARFLKTVPRGDNQGAFDHTIVTVELNRLITLNVIKAQVARRFYEMHESLLEGRKIMLDQTFS